MKKIALFIGLSAFLIFNTAYGQSNGQRYQVNSEKKQQYQQRQLPAQMPPQTVNNPANAFTGGYLRVYGESAAGQGRYAALRSARVIAQRDMIETLKGISINGFTTVQQGMLSNDTIRSSVEGFLRGARECGSKYDRSQGLGTVCMEIGTKQVLSQMYADHNIMRAIRKIVPNAPEYQPSVKKAITPVKYDGLIINASQDSLFRPALVNRIMAPNGDILYDPTKIAEEILVERGSGDYTNTIGKARAILSERGVHNPLIAKAVNIIKFTDVEVSAGDATKIYASNQTSNFLEGAKVVFVLK